MPQETRELPVSDEAASIIAERSKHNTLHVIVNPAAGSGRAGRRWPEFNTALAEHGFTTVAHFTTRRGDATDIARRLAEERVHTIVVVGGDGTINEVVNGLIRDDRPISPDTRLALLPCGTGKDLARALGVVRTDAALRALDAGTTASIDIGRIRYVDGITGQEATRYYANCADTGLGAEAAARINASSKRLGTIVTYLRGAIHAILTFKFRDASIEVDGRLLHSGRAGMMIFANSRTFAGGMQIAPDASPCDGLLDILVLQDVGKRALLFSLLPRVYRGKHIGRPGVLHTLGRQARVTSPVTMLLEVDGEQVGRAPLTVDVVPNVLKVVGVEDVLARASGCTKPVG